MKVAGRFFAIFTHPPFIKLDRKFNFTYVTFPIKKVVRIIITLPFPEIVSH
jgi:hypothetical protein